MDGHTNKSEGPKVADYLSEIFAPCEEIAECDDQLHFAELVQRMKREIPFDFQYLDLEDALRELGFKKEAIEGVGYWLVKYA